MSMKHLIKRLEEAKREKVDYWRSVNGQNIGFRGTEGKGDAVVGPSAIIGGGGSGGANRSSAAAKKLDAAYKEFQKMIGQEFGNSGPDDDDEDGQVEYQIVTDALMTLGRIVDLYKDGESPKKISELVKEFYSSGEADTASQYIDINKLLKNK